jgi:hypothetical protein
LDPGPDQLAGRTIDEGMGPHPLGQLLGVGRLLADQRLGHRGLSLRHPLPAAGSICRLLTRAAPSLSPLAPGAQGRGSCDRGADAGMRRASSGYPWATEGARVRGCPSARLAGAAGPDGAGTRLLFRHAGWPDDYSEQEFASVNFVWGQILARLKGYCETGRPQPFFG